MPASTHPQLAVCNQVIRLTDPEQGLLDNLVSSCRTPCGSCRVCSFGMAGTISFGMVNPAIFEHFQAKIDEDVQVGEVGLLMLF